MSGAAYYLRGVLGGKKNSDGSKKEKLEKSKIVSIKEKSQKKSGSVFNDFGKMEEVSRRLKGDFQKTFNTSFELKTMIKNGGTDLEKLQIKAIHSQLGVIAKMLDNLKK